MGGHGAVARIRGGPRGLRQEGGTRSTHFMGSPDDPHRDQRRPERVHEGRERPYIISQLLTSIPQHLNLSLGRRVGDREPANLAVRFPRRPRRGALPPPAQAVLPQVPQDPLPRRGRADHRVGRSVLESGGEWIAGSAFIWRADNTLGGRTKTVQPPVLLDFLQRSGSRILRRSSVGYERLPNRLSVGYGLPDQRTRNFPFAEAGCCWPRTHTAARERTP